MVAFLSPRLWMLVGLAVALAAALLAGVKTESNLSSTLILSACTTSPSRASLKDCPRAPAELMGEIPQSVSLAEGTSSTTSTRTGSSSQSAEKN